MRSRAARCDLGGSGGMQNFWGVFRVSEIDSSSPGSCVAQTALLLFLLTLRCILQVSLVNQPVFSGLGMRARKGEGSPGKASLPPSPSVRGLVHETATDSLNNVCSPNANSSSANTCGYNYTVVAAVAC